MQCPRVPCLSDLGEGPGAPGGPDEVGRADRNSRDVGLQPLSGKSPLRRIHPDAQGLDVLADPVPREAAEPMSRTRQCLPNPQRQGGRPFRETCRFSSRDDLEMEPVCGWNISPRILDLEFPCDLSDVRRGRRAPEGLAEDYLEVGARVCRLRASGARSGSSDSR